MSGGTTPEIGSQATIESPEPVSLVTPPSTTIAKTSAQQTSSQTAMARLAVRARAAAPAPRPASGPASTSMLVALIAFVLDSSEAVGPPSQTAVQLRVVGREVYREPALE